MRKYLKFHNIMGLLIIGLLVSQVPNIIYKKIAWNKYESSELKPFVVVGNRIYAHSWQFESPRRPLMSRATGVDHTTFELVPEKGGITYARDKNGVYISMNGGVHDLNIKDPASLVHVRGEYYKDKYNVYHGKFLEKVPGADPDDFRIGT